MTVTVTPAGAGSATASISGHGNATSGMTGWWKSYLLEATANAGYFFSHFEITYSYTSPNGTETGIVEKPSPSGGSTSPDYSKNGLGEFDITYSDGRIYRRTMNVKAVFTAKAVVVKTSPLPTFAGATSGDGTYIKGSKVTISAKPKCSPWVFDHWEIPRIGNVESATYSFIVEENASCYAYFKHADTGEIIYDVSSGMIMCNSTSQILYNGKETNQPKQP